MSRPPIMNLRQMNMLHALTKNHYYLSMTDALDDDVQSLLEQGLIYEWETIGGFPAISITDNGRATLALSAPLSP